MSAQIISLAGARRARSVTVPSPSSAKRGRGHRSENREACFQQWRNAASLAEFYDALRRLQCAAAIGEKHGHAEAAVLHQYIGDYWVILDEYRKAVARCILTPAPTRREIEWKRVELRRGGLQEHITEAKALAAIAADEKWHDENPYRRTSRGMGRKEDEA